MKASLGQGNQVLSLFSGASEEQVQKIIEAGDLLKMMMYCNLADVDREQFRQLLQPSLPEFSVLVDYRLTLDQMIEAGRYDWKNSGITSNFPVNCRRDESADVTMFLVKYDRSMESDDIIKDLDVRNLRAAELPELLALGAQNPDIQREFPIVALGSVWVNYRGHRSVPVLSRKGDARYLDLNNWVSGWHSRARFLAARK